jgi:hypothetical protein
MLGLDSATHCERDDDPENCAIEITPEMIEAGVAQLLGFNRDFESEEDAVMRIYMAMRIKEG